MSLNPTPIEWAKNPDGTQGFTWNPITGCLNHDNGMCKGGGFPCYAYKLANGRLRERYLANKNVAPKIGKDVLFREYQVPTTEYADPFYPRFWPNRFGIIPFSPPTKPLGIFVCDMGELFGDWVPEAWQESVFTSIRAHWDHRFYLLTKQPQNLAKWSPFPDNCWVGVTATGDKMMLGAIKYLKQIQAKIKYISIEPLLERIDCHWIELYLNDAGINQLIIGAQTKPYKPPRIEWVDDILGASDRAGIPVFIKDNLGMYLPMFPGYYQRQELPKGEGVKE